MVKPLWRCLLKVSQTNMFHLMYAFAQTVTQALIKLKRRVNSVLSTTEIKSK